MPIGVREAGMVVLLLAERGTQDHRIGKSMSVLGWEKAASRRGQGGWVRQMRAIEGQPYRPRCIDRPGVSKICV